MTTSYQAEYLRIRDWAREARSQYHLAKVANTTLQILRDQVVERREYSRTNRHLTLLDVAGPEASVSEYVGGILETDTCTPQYEHMLWQVNKVTLQNGYALVSLTKTNYAGD